MKDIREIIDRIKNADTRVQLVVLAIIVLVVIFIGFNRFNDTSDRNIGLNSGDSLPNEIDSGIEDALSGSGGRENTASVANSVPTSNGSQRIKLALLAGSFYNVDFGGKERGCDTVVMIEHPVPNTPAVLNASLKALFNDTINTDFLPGNFIATQENLSFDEARIEGGVAKIFLSGEAGPIAGDCDADRTKIQVEETALQYGSVNSVEVYLNGERI